MFNEKYVWFLKYVISSNYLLISDRENVLVLMIFLCIRFTQVRQLRE